jgi:Fe2+ transport system protein B
VALVGGFAAKIVLATLGTLPWASKATGSRERKSGSRLESTDGFHTHRVCDALNPCVATLVVIRKIRVMGWTLFAMAYTTIWLY